MYQANISILINKKVISNRKSTEKILEKKAEYAIPKRHLKVNILIE